jgi:delta 1-pyrroline-5-carboxylate dehydrogenase
LIVVVHTLAHAIGALRAAACAEHHMTLLSAPNAGIYAGPGWFAAVVEAAHQAAPDAQFSALLDCGDRPGAALGAIRAQIEAVIFTGRADVARRLADIASQSGVRLITEPPAADLDLGDAFFASEAESEKLCAEFFASPAAKR